MSFLTPSLPQDPEPAVLAVAGEPSKLRALQPPGEVATPGLDEVFGPLGLSCTPRLLLRAAPGATVDLRIETPCQPSTQVTLTHDGITADYLTSSSGIIETRFPALSDSAQFDALLADGQTLSASIEVPGAEHYEHVVSMWSGDIRLGVHAFEFGASEGGAGHVWRGGARVPDVAEAGRGGFLMVLGSGSWPGAAQAEVYAFPADTARLTGTVRIALAAEVTPATCGRALTAVLMQRGDGLPGAPVDLSLTLPDCGAADGVLMLKNLARDLKIAAE